jgi:hypothetical protein
MARSLFCIDMEEHFLRDFVSGPRGTEHKPWWNPAGDCIIYQTVDEASVAHRIDDILTIYVSVISGKPIGFQIKGIAAMSNKFGWDGAKVECMERDKEILDVSLTALLLAAYESGPKTIGRRKSYIEAFEFSPRQTSLEISSPLSVQ